MMATLWSRLRWPLLAVALVLGSLAVRATVEQHQAYLRAQAFERGGDVERAVDEYRWALRWYTPWGPDYDRAAEALLALAESQSDDQPELAVQSWDNLRSGLIAGRSLWQPRADLVARASSELPKILVRLAKQHGDRRDANRLLTRFTDDYQRPIGVGAGISAAVSLGFIAWLAGLLLAAAKGFDADGRWQRRGWRWVALAAGGFATWGLALWLG